MGAKTEKRLRNLREKYQKNARKNENWPLPFRNWKMAIKGGKVWRRSSEWKWRKKGWKERCEGREKKEGDWCWWEGTGGGY